jgi:hypothetical protein
MSKMASHESFGHLQHKLWQKEGPGVKLLVWLPTTKSRESTRPWCVQRECDTSLKSSQGEIHVCFRPHPTRRAERKVMNLQSPRSPNRDSFRTNNHSDVYAVEWRREYYMGEGGGFPQVQAVVSLVGPELPVAYCSTKFDVSSNK